MKKDTLLTHVGRDPAQTHGTVNMPVYRTSTVVFQDLESYETRDPDDFKSMRYGIHGTPTTFAFEEAVARMEGGHMAVAVPSGLAAITAALCAFVKHGDHLLMTDSAYAPTRIFCEKQLRKNGIEIEYYDPLVGAGIASLIRPNTRAVFCEAPGSLTFEMQDIPAIAAAAHARNIPVLADTTWGTPYFFRSFDRGVDVSIHAATKYIVGHSDVMMGVIVTNEKYWLPVRRAVGEFGFCVSPDDCYMALRGFRTIGVRMKQQMANALTVARWLAGRPEVQRVLYPALENDPGHAIWKRDFDGAASLFGVILRTGDRAKVTAMVNALKLFGIGSSWGGYESLVTAPHPEKVRSATQWNPGGATIRLHIGLEDPADLVADLEQALARVR
ncbi:MAG: cystathionine beta-lyase [Betaproteobacteria bacterium]|jgi:cystathionine beta-lyase|nr:cystathionine beta-lyase [Betaproteobacteria bacterium]MDH4292860.1 cystathionine beta-lyase [Betaproteobacteria bacterium]MDH5342611.1 cystathionine beta-lyase [Betaproteobacteria bacterium]